MGDSVIIIVVDNYIFCALEMILCFWKLRTITGLSISGFASL